MTVFNDKANKTREAYRKLYLILLRVVVLGVLIVTLGACLQKLHYFFEWCTHFRLQAFNGSWLLVVGFALVRQWRWVSIAGLLTVWHAIAVAPIYFQSNPVDLQSSHTLNKGRAVFKVMLSNVYRDNSEFERLLEAIAKEQPDIFVIQEFTPDWAHALAGLERNYPYSVLDPREGSFGIGVYSQFPLVDADLMDMTGAQIPTIVSKVHINGELITLVATHPMAPVNGAMAALRNRQLKQLQTLLVDLLGPVVLIGDLNTTPWSQHFAQLLSEPRFRSVREGFGWLPTWPAMLPPFLRIPIDHCLVTSELDVLALDLGHNVGSDHLPLVVTLAL